MAISNPEASLSVERDCLILLISAIVDVDGSKPAKQLLVRF
jgi:hypothetical protein